LSASRLPIETERLIIRPLQLDDAHDLHELYSDAGTMRFLETNVPATIDESQAWVQSKIDLFERDGGMSLWALVERESGRVIGDAGLQWEAIGGARGLDLGCRVVRRLHGRGCATEASAAILRAAFGAGFIRVTAQTAFDNEAALHVLRRIGFRVEGETEWQGRQMAFAACRQPGMDVGDVLAVLTSLDGLHVLLDGGWGMDALLGEQTRAHRDLDLAVDATQLIEAERRLATLGYEETEEGRVGRPTRAVFVDPNGRLVDLHPLAFDSTGDGWQLLPDGRHGLYPAGELAVGTIAGRAVPCISASLQVRHHRGYVLAEHDRADLRRLAEPVDAGT
jgi:lincosamide nucleotidyltransferase A/C/D/E